MFTRYAFLVGTIITIAINSLSSLPLNGISTAEISNNLQTLITPAGFTFSIRGLIYIILIIISLGLATKRISIPSSTLGWYVLSCFFNSLWIFARHYQFIWISRLLILALFGSLVMVLQSYDSANTGSNVDQQSNWFRQGLFVYFARTSIASLVLTTIIVTYQIDVFPIDLTIWAIGLITAATILFQIIALKKKSFVPLLVLLRARYGIYMETSDQNIQITIIVTAMFALSTILIKNIEFLHNKIFYHTK